MGLVSSHVQPASSEASVSAAKQEEGFGVRLLKLVGWMGGFYSRKAVSSLYKRLYSLQLMMSWSFL